jgi:hypothetical protein
MVFCYRSGHYLVTANLDQDLRYLYRLTINYTDDMQKSRGLSLMLVCIAVILVSGCTNAELGVVEGTPIPTATPEPVQIIQQITLTATTAPHTTIATPTPTPTVKKTTAAPTGPALAKTLTINVKSNEIKRFTTQGAGTVRVMTILGGKEKECNGGGAITLSGPGYDATLASNSVGSSVPKKIIHIPGPGEYTLATRGCYSWQVVIANGA